MIQRAVVPFSQLYETDETAWLEEMAALIHQQRWEDLDYAHLEEYLGDVAARDRRRVESRLTTLLMHVLKWIYQPDHRTLSWRSTILERQQKLRREADRGVLRKHAEAVLSQVYPDAVARAAVETGLPATSFPAQCPFALDQLLSPDFPAD